jgi:hypothetical protein
MEEKASSGIETQNTRSLLPPGQDMHGDCTGMHNQETAR